MSTAESQSRSRPLVVVMGVSGSGKTAVGEALAARLALPFIEGDRFHPPENVAKMSSGVPLDDNDRWPWLDRIGAELARAGKEGSGAVVACSALKLSYRERLRKKAGPRLIFVFLKGPRDLLAKRLAGRRGHFMPPSLLDSQLATLEDPSAEPDVVTVDIAPPVVAIAEAASRAISSLAG